MVNISIFNATVVTMDKYRRIIEDGAVIVSGDRIFDVGETEDFKSKYGEDGKVIDGTGMLAIPGLVNAHTHDYEILFRSLGDDLGPLLNWSDTMLMPAGPSLDDEVIYAGTLLSCLEMIKSGTTFFIDNMCTNTRESVVDRTAQAVKETGIKGLLARGMSAQNERLAKIRPNETYPPVEEAIRLTEKAIRKWHGKVGGRVLVCPQLGITAFAGDDLLLEAKRLSDKYGVPMHGHTAEVRDEVEASIEDHGKREIERLYDLGVLGPKFHVVHGVWLDNGEIRMMGETKANLIHCPESNMYLASGVAPVPQLIRAGANVALGTDVSCNENNDMIRAMKTTVLLHKVHTLDPKVIPAGQALEMATIGGARALGLEKEIGTIEPGKKADIVLVNLRKPHIVPAHRVVPSLVYNACGADVETVIIDGKVVMENRKVKTVDEQVIVEKALEVADSLVERAGITHLKNRPQFI